MKIVSFVFLIFISNTASSFSLLPEPLTDSDIEQYIKAYDNIALVSPQIKIEQEKINSKTILTCKKCRSLISDAVIKAGYKDFKSFLLIDIRIHVVLHYYYKLELSKVIGDEISNVPLDDVCELNEQLKDIKDIDEMDLKEEGLFRNIEIANAILNNKDAKKLDEQCENILLWGGYLQGFSSASVSIAEKFMNKADFKKIGKYLEAIKKALTNPELIDEYKHVKGGGFDD